MTKTRCCAIALLAVVARSTNAAPLETGDVLIDHFGGKIQQYRAGVLAGAEKLAGERRAKLGRP